MHELNLADLLTTFTGLLAKFTLEVWLAEARKQRSWVKTKPHKTIRIAN